MRKKIDFSKYSSIKVGPICDVKVIERCDEIEKDDYILGSASNVLVSNDPPPLAILSKRFDYIELDGSTLKIGAATPSGKIVSFCKKHDLGGLEFLSHLPGKLGGLVKMNAGMKEYEIFNPLIDITTCNGKKTKNEIEFGYRYTKIDDVVLQARFAVTKGFDSQKVKMFQKMRANQPKKASAGSCFKNPPNDYAGRLIEAVGLKGKRLGGMGWSEVHANFLVNYGGGTYEEAISLIQEAERKVLWEFGISLKREIVIL